MTSPGWILLPLCLFLLMTLLSSDFTSLRVKKWGCGAFCLLLAGSAVLLYAVPKDRLAEQAPIAVQAASASGEADFSDLIDGGYEDSDKFYVNGKWEFLCTGGTLNLQISVGGGPVYVRYKKADDKKAEVISCVTPSTVGGCDITRQIRPPTAELSGDTLRIAPPSFYTLEKSIFPYDFTIRQFCRNVRDGNSDSLFLGSGALLIRLPKDLPINSNIPVDIAYEK